MHTDAPSRRRGRPETALAIERAAIDLVLDRGYDHVTVDMICEASGVSQRTFFNYFRTKDAALIGTAAPSIDADRAADFVTSTGPLLAELVGVIAVDPEFVTHGEALFVDRIRAISSNPELLARQMESFAKIESELRALILERLRHESAGTSTADVDLDEQAALIAQLLAGAVRYVGLDMAAATEAGRTPQSPEQLAALIGRVLPKLG